MDNPKVIVKETGKYDKGLFAKDDISKGEIRILETMQFNLKNING